MKYLGATLNTYLSFKQFIAVKCKKCNFSLRNIKEIRKYLSEKCFKQLVNNLITSQLDYANGLLDNLPYASYKPLQRIQNRSAKLMLLQSTYDRSTRALKELAALAASARTSAL